MTASERPDGDPSFYRKYQDVLDSTGDYIDEGADSKKFNIGIAFYGIMYRINSKANILNNIYNHIIRWEDNNFFKFCSYKSIKNKLKSKNLEEKYDEDA